MGGASANAAIGLHYHGVPVKLWSKVGNDSFGKFLLSRLSDYGISTDSVVQDSQHPTKLAFVGLRENGERYFEFYNRNSADMHMQVSDFNFDELKKTKIFCFGGIALLGDVTVNTLMQILNFIIKEKETLVLLDPNIRMDLVKNPDMIFDRFTQILNFVDILKLSKDDWKQFFGEKTPHTILQKGISLIILTDGENGVRLITEQSEVSVPAEKVKEVDTTGAGDAFTAAFLSKLIHERVSIKNITSGQLRAWGKFANHWGGKIVQFPGAVILYFKSIQS